MLHEVTLDHRQWTPQSEVLRGTFRVFRLDWRGHGKSATSPSGHGWSGFAADAQRALVQVGMDRLHPGVVIAHGYACDAALQLARREPRAVRALVLVAPIFAGAGLGAEWQALLAAMRAAVHADDLPRALELLRATTGRLPACVPMRSWSAACAPCKSVSPGSGCARWKTKHLRDSVAAAAVIGLSGQSGLAPEPMLQWRIYLHGVAVDPTRAGADALTTGNGLRAQANSLRRSERGS